MSLFQYLRKTFIALTLVLVLVTTSACSAVAQQDRTSYQPGASTGAGYAALSRGDTAQGQNFGDWVVKTSQGLIQDAYVRDNNKLGVVISPQVRPKEVKPLAQSLVQGFRRSATPNRDLTVLVYAPDKQLLLSARYNPQSKQIEYNS
ncbi:hypothetical protein K9N68_30430 [Kovacikia minuta CCNUW1]|uniref:hypothetical protein n=1 Tax=Kovacikia minuta TaxID=2931930 RepID=UPI001CCCDAC9|nr:hypothetical protein [Kovacikia minuta]UBF25816.1 hypothetical protein K9N68_30430 [Kovacikia minuta CCNUW1]